MKQVRRDAGSRYAGTQVRRYAGTQVRKYAGTQVRREAGKVQGRRYAVRRYAVDSRDTQVSKYAGTQGSREAGIAGTQVR